MRIETSRCIIRNLVITDLNDFHDYRSNPDVTKYQGFDVMNISQAADFIEQQKGKAFGKACEWIQYAIETKADGRLVGDCAIKLDANDTRIAEIGLTLSHRHQQKGYAKEVMKGILNFLFYEKRILRVVEITDAENTASMRLLESIGFRKEGHFIENIFFKGNWASEFQYALLKREWDELNKL